MKTPISLLAIVVFVLVACGKDKFLTVPSLRLKFKSTDVVPMNGSLRLILEFTDKEGDVHDSVWVKKKVEPESGSNTSRFSSIQITGLS